ncbi:hypothetical protein WJX72_001541 [[Myrmecia] bisecta]|uniref:Uncharacterized protein n=1 Tax=[Myrmecia] bisecta TaxID=41462 RepID=A0AAW1QB73_9CHLO
MNRDMWTEAAAMADEALKTRKALLPKGHSYIGRASLLCAKALRSDSMELQDMREQAFISLQRKAYMHALQLYKAHEEEKGFQIAAILEQLARLDAAELKVQLAIKQHREAHQMRKALSLAYTWLFRRNTRSKLQMTDVNITPEEPSTSAHPAEPARFGASPAGPSGTAGSQPMLPKQQVPDTILPSQGRGQAGVHKE